jgi:predicted PurR-regulated permease PerM
MELFIPGLSLFFLTIVVTFLIVPRFTPLIIAVLSIIVLVVAIWQHYSMFQDEYRLSTWQESLKVYAPAIMIIAIILFIIYTILSLFTKGAVPIPSVPNISMPSADSATNQVVESLNKVATSLGNVSSNIVSSVNSMMGQNVSQGSINQSGSYKNNKGNLSRSFLETL